MNAGQGTVLRRKASARRGAPALAQMTALKAMRLAVARSGDEMLGCPVTLREMTEASGEPETLAKELPDPALLVQMEGPCGVMALVALCPQVVAAAIEAQTLGRVPPKPAPDRQPTRTDAMMVAEFLEYLLAGFAAMAEPCDTAAPLSGFDFTGALPDLRTALLLLPEAEHCHYGLTLDFARGAKTGALHVLVPMGRVKGAPDGADWSERLANAVRGSSVWLEAILCRKRMRLSDITGLKVGDVVHMDTADLGTISLIGSNGKRALGAALGRSGAMRAVRLDLKGSGPASRRAPPAPMAAPEPVPLPPEEPLPVAQPLAEPPMPETMPLPLPGIEDL